MSDAKSLIEQIAAGEHDQVSQHPEGYEVCLRFPFKSGSETVDKLIVRRPRVKHFRATDAVEGDMAKNVALAAALTQRSQKELDELDLADWTIVQSCIAGFSAPARPTDSGAAEQQRSALAGMSQAELQRMAGMGGLVGEQAARALQQQREVMATANKLTTIVPAAFKAASRASPPVLDAEETAPPIFMDKAAMPMRTEFDGSLKIVLDSTTGEVRRTEAKTSGPLKMFVNDGAV